MPFSVNGDHTSTNSVNWFSTPKPETNHETDAEKWKKTNIFDVAAAATAGAYMQ